MTDFPPRRHDMRAAYRLTATVSVVGLLGACGSPTDSDADPRTGTVGIPGQVATVEVIPDRATVRIGDTTQLAVQLRDHAGGEAIGTVTWRTVGFGAVTVSQTGLIVGVTPGQARVVATSNGKADTAVVDVPHIPVASIELTSTSTSFPETRSTELTAVPRDAAGTALRGKHLLWSTSDPVVATVSSKGVVTGRGAGAVVITVSSEGTSSSVRLVMQPVFTDVSAGADHACGVTTRGAVYCWGANQAGQLGDGTTQDRMEPVRVSGAGQYLKVFAGVDHTCAITSGYQHADCWGSNASGQLGDGTRTARLTPVRVAGGLWWYAYDVRVGPNVTCASNWSNTVPEGRYCWGDVALSSASAPQLTPIRGTFAATIVGFGDSHFCSYSTCSGANDFGQLGDGTTIARSTPVPFLYPGGAGELVAGGNHSCISPGVVMCWGRFPDGEVVTTPRALAMDALPRVSLTSGRSHVCVLDYSNEAHCWGSNEFGQLGDGTTAMRLRMTRVAAMPYLKWVDAGAYHTCALTHTEQAACWGRNDRGQLGNGTTTSHSTPTIVVIR